KVLSTKVNHPLTGRKQAIRKIALSQISVFIALLACAGGGAVITCYLLGAIVPEGDFRGVILTVLAIFSVYAYALVIYRVLLSIFPLHLGEVEPGSALEVSYHV